MSSVDTAHLTSFAAECSDGCRPFIHSNMDVSDDLYFLVNTVMSELRATDFITGAKKKLKNPGMSYRAVYTVRLVRVNRKPVEILTRPPGFGDLKNSSLKFGLRSKLLKYY